ncbi:DNA-directed RNA polymerase I subunit RPA1, putative [Entamoeba invadens IP1]|uniref:DNA-directed RNA polymerase subunit n=1 Tax=Entamoeba invadens IP1 TaxID=370355 RepID=A0A0A1U5W2_ENTIV|nr:DNA-directed RNA polymerase I subunit RPA1, putative [Entamoeba invadens IP1]ELP88260.1 DNA-directed RNA polymerase I subunit RPA1, putative [Entamoeba invadens IP1]|eukprot:XP_004255031.1 DNA-directed RNA polymerase I subunit RPA1, putative [Entamoeba invadens IP1]
MSQEELRKTFQDKPVDLSQASFDFYSADEIRHLSVKEVTKGATFDLLGNPEENGLYDPSLGVIERRGVCRTCGLNEDNCPGHFGHFELEEPMYNPLMFDQLILLLRSICLECFTLKASQQTLLGVAIELARLDKNDIGGALAINELAEEAKKVQMRANASRGKLKHEQENEEYDYETDVNISNKLLKIFENECSKRIKKEPGYIHTEIQKRNVVKSFLMHMASLSQKKCPCCGKISPKIKKSDNKYSIWFYGETAGVSTKEDGKKYDTTPSFIMNILKQAWEKDKVQKEVLSRLCYTQMRGGDKLDVILPSYHMFFVECLPIPPSRFRPLNRFGNMISDNPQTSYYKAIIENSQNLHLKRGKKEITLTENMLIENMQKGYNQLILNKDSSMPASIKTTLEHKVGLFRSNMMGKRVNYAARTVISPDPFIPTNTFGIPMPFAMRLSVATPVNERNFEEMKKAVVNGPMTWPGALSIEDEWGKTYLLPDDSDPYSVSKRQGEADRLLAVDPTAPRNFKTVRRHVIDGDMILTNRQPTLHKPGIMGHYVKVLKVEKTMRMHYSNCNTFNADFDGDEMNMHLPQSIIARSEIQNIALSDEQYVVPKNGQPLRGLIQDHIISSFMLTKRNTFFNREQFCQIVSDALYGVNESYSISLPTPTILKPTMLWTGKQVVSAILLHVGTNQPHINFTGKCKVSTNEIGEGGYQTEEQKKLRTQKDGFREKWDGANDSQCIIKESVLITGTLDKNQIGASNGGLIHCIYELYNAKTAGLCLSIFSRLLTNYLQRVGHTCSLDDCMLTPEFDAKRTELLNKANEVSRAATAKHFGLTGRSKFDIDVAFSNARRRVESAKDLDNAVKSEVNDCTSLVIKECIPNGQLKAFPWNCLALMTTTGAKGSKVNHSQITCLLGQQELEGRRVPIMATGKTLPSFPRYDASAKAGGFIAARFLTGVPPQEFYFHCMAGREGLIDTAVKTANSGYLQRCIIKMMESLHVEYDYTVRESDGSIVQFMYGDDGIDVMKSAFLNNIDFWAKNYKAIVTKYDTASIARSFKDGYKEAMKLHRDCSKHPEKHDPVLSVYSPGNNLAACSEKYYNLVNQYIKEDKNKDFKEGRLDEKKFRTMMMVRYNKCLVNPGEPVGIVAGQSIGEPSTQMTLNTFHLAGRGDVNVTLGMPRMKELVMFAKRNISTPSMVLYLNDPNQKNTEDLAKKLTKVTLDNIVEGITCIDSIVTEGSVRKRKYHVKLQLVSNYKTLVEFVEKQLVEKIQGAIHTEIVKKLKIKDVNDVTYNDAGNEETGAVVVQEESDKKHEKVKKGLKATRDEDEKSDESSEESVDKNMSEEPEKSEETDKSEESEDEKKKPKKKENKTKITKEVKNLEVEITLGVNDKVSMVSVVEKVITKIVLYECPKIKRGLPLTKKKDGKTLYYVMTEGVNLRKMAEFAEYVDVNTIESNDVYAVSQTYGVEAARAVLINEIGGVFRAYGIEVDSRHLNLVGDAMMFEGEYKPLNRSGMDSNPSVFTKITFETSLSFLAKACMSGQIDNLHSPSSTLTLGKHTTFGTGSFDLLNDYVMKSD